MNDPNKKWFTEKCTECGTAYSIEINNKLHEEQTAFQNIEIYSTKNFGNLMVIDGFVMLTERDNFIYHEMMAHPVMFSHPDPKHVVIVGGGDCGTLCEILKHSCVNKITQVEIDERVTQLTEKFFPDLCANNQDPRIEFIFTDATKWVKQANNNSIDIIIVDSTDPIGPAEHLFTTPFYRDCLRVLKPDGLLAQQSESPLIHFESIIQPMHHCMRDAGFTNTELIFFPLPSYPTGWWSATIANQLESIPFHREQEIKQFEATTHYYNLAIHHACKGIPQFIKNKLL